MGDALLEPLFGGEPTGALEDAVDATMQLVDTFRPNESQRKGALEIQKHRPVSVKE